MDKNQELRAASDEMIEAFSAMVVEAADRGGFACMVSLRVPIGDDDGKLYVFSNTTVENTKLLIVSAGAQVLMGPPNGFGSVAEATAAAREGS